ncbi:MAG: phosphoribosylformimino-5-aminoimidazole carboxamide ribotide isomerase [Akkermansiaceae bacterium]|nr:phosphoribosylformimino-5-aminoimidazole carboxamide ribotide isomerase [Akkermansiaceae bacterium]
MKQIVGSSLSDEGDELRTNFTSSRPAVWFAERYRRDGLRGGHLIMLGPGNEKAARKALSAWPGGLQAGGGISLTNAVEWLEAGASHVIATSCLFDAAGRFCEESLRALSSLVGAARLVVDLSCRKTAAGWRVVMNRWQTLTSLCITPGVLDSLAEHCDEFLIHSADVEGLCQGIDRGLVEMLGSWGGGRPVTYAGGVRCLEDFYLIDVLSGGRVDATVGSALDLFGGSGVRYADLVSREAR